MRNPKETITRRIGQAAIVCKALHFEKGTPIFTDLQPIVFYASKKPSQQDAEKIAHTEITADKLNGQTLIVTEIKFVEKLREMSINTFVANSTEVTEPAAKDAKTAEPATPTAKDAK